MVYSPIPVGQNQMEIEDRGGQITSWAVTLINFLAINIKEEGGPLVPPFPTLGH